MTADKLEIPQQGGIVKLVREEDRPDFKVKLANAKPSGIMLDMQWLALTMIIE
jgi:hypothetical protein